MVTSESEIATFILQCGVLLTALHYSVTSHTRVGQGTPMKEGVLQESTGLYLVTGKVLVNEPPSSAPLEVMIYTWLTAQQAVTFRIRLSSEVK